VTSVVSADGVILERILQATYPIWHHGLSRQAYGRFDVAQMKTAWGRGHQRRVALVEGGELLASARQYDLAGVLYQRPVRVCGIGEVFTRPLHRRHGRASTLVERLLAAASS
jgi:hypothetical protein